MPGNRQLKSAYHHFNNKKITKKESALTSPFSVCAVRAASTVLFIASHAHLSLLRVHGSGSSFRLGVYKVGHSADFRFSEGNVNADDVGTGSR